METNLAARKPNLMIRSIHGNKFLWKLDGYWENIFSKRNSYCGEMSKKDYWDISSWMWSLKHLWGPFDINKVNAEHWSGGAFGLKHLIHCILSPSSWFHIFNSTPQKKSPNHEPVPSISYFRDLFAEVNCSLWNNINQDQIKLDATRDPTGQALCCVLLLMAFSSSISCTGLEDGAHLVATVISD